MATRRGVGPAYEKSPIQGLTDWVNRNVLIVLSGLIGGIAFWFTTNWVIDGMLNFLSTGGDETMAKPYDSNEPMWIVVKLVGSIFVLIIIVKSKSK